MADSGSARFTRVAETWEQVRARSGRLEKRAAMARFFRSLSPTDLRIAACYLAGELPQGRLGVGWRTLQDAARRKPEKAPRQGSLDLGSPTASTTLTIQDADRAFDAIQRVHGRGSKQRRAGALSALLARTGAKGRSFLGHLLMGELRQGAASSLVLDALAEGFEIDPDALRRAAMFAGDPGRIAEAIAAEGASALGRFGPTPLQPVAPMLASTAQTLADGLAELPGASMEWKIDGVRVQVHRAGGTLRVFSRQLRDITDRIPELHATLRALPGERLIADGEVVGLDAQGRPVPFQDLMSRFSRDEVTAPLGEQLPLASFESPRQSPVVQRLTVQLFDLLLLDEQVLLIDAPYRERRALLEARFPAELLVKQRYAGDDVDAEAFYREALDAQQEGLVLKAPDSAYAAGRRGASWRKVKPSVTLDLVILAAEWGHGRRQGWLSNLHLGARDPQSPYGFRMLGKTFKGLSDAMLQELTDALPQIAVAEESHVLRVRPERVVEIAFDVVQRSPRYDSGLALRFARVKRFRPDKAAADATSLEEIRAIHQAQR